MHGKTEVDTVKRNLTVVYKQKPTEISTKSVQLQEWLTNESTLCFLD